MSHITYVTVSTNPNVSTVSKKLGSNVTRVAIGVPGPVAIDVVRSDTIDYFVTLTQAEFNAIVTPDPRTIYFIQEEA